MVTTKNSSSSVYVPSRQVRMPGRKRGPPPSQGRATCPVIPHPRVHDPAATGYRQRAPISSACPVIIGRGSRSIPKPAVKNATLRIADKFPRKGSHSSSFHKHELSDSTGSHLRTIVRDGSKILQHTRQPVRGNGRSDKMDKRAQIELSGMISEANSSIDLLKLFADNEAIVNKIHLSNLWNKLGRRRDASNPRFALGITQMMQRTTDLIETCGPRELANIAHGAAKARLDLGETERFLKGIGIATVSRGLHGFKPQELVNLVWAFATAGVNDDKLFTAVADEALAQQLRGFKPQELTNMVWSFEKAGARNKKLYIAVANEAVKQKLYGFKPQELSNIIWVFARAGVRVCKLYTAVANEIMKQGLHCFNSQDLANTVWAFATACVHNKALFVAVAEEAVRQNLRGFKPQELANMVWAFATAGVRVDKLYMAVANEVVRQRLHGFIPQNISNMVWAFATAGVSANSLYATVTDEVLRQNLHEFKSQELSNMVWAFATAGLCDDRLFRAVADEALRQNFRGFKPQELVNIAWSFATVGVCTDELYMALANEAVRQQLHGFTLQGLVNLIWTFGVVNINHIPLFEKFKQVLTQASPSDLSKEILVSIHQWLVWLYLEHRVYYDTLNLLDSIHDKCQAAMQDSSIRVSRLQNNVGMILSEVRKGFEEEFVDEHTSYSIDLALHSSRIAVEVDGPSHFISCRNNKQIMNGSTLFKRRLLTAAGWKVINLSYNKWGSLRNDFKKKEFIHSLLREVEIR